MEVMLRCGLPDRPGALAALAGAIAEAGGDIQAVDVVEHADGRALDDLVVVADPGRLASLVERLEALPEVELVHVGPSRGHPGDAVTRLAVGLQSLLDGAMTPEHALQTLVGGLLRASSADFVPAQDTPVPCDGVLVVAVDERVLVVRRDYRFTDTERARAAAIAALCLQATAVRT